MEFVPVRALSQERKTVMDNLRRNGELVITNNGQPIALMINLVGRDLVETVHNVRKQGYTTPSTGRCIQQLEALEELLDSSRKVAGEPLDQEFDDLITQGVHFAGELVL